MVEALDQPPYEARKGESARIWLYSCIFWLALGPLIGLFQSVQFFAPDFMEFIAPAGLAYSKLRIMHTNLVIYGWLGMAFIGAAHYLIPHLLRTELFSERVGQLSAWLRTVALAVSGVPLVAGIPGHLFPLLKPCD